MPPRLITFLSDFGREDWFVGVVHGVVHELCPQARIVDLTHEIPPGQIERAAFVLEAAAPDFPVGTVHLAVVDPGVGTDRRALAVSARGQFFVGPDNGLLEWGLAAPESKVHQLTEERFFRHPVSRTFHGRDVFAPVAAHLAKGAVITALGSAVPDPVRLPRRAPRRQDGWLVGRIMYIDRFGNALVNLTEQDLSDAFPTLQPSRLRIRIGGWTVRGVSRSYGDAPIGTLLAVIGSSGRLEIAQVGGDASERLGLGEGDEIGIGLDV